MSLRALYGDQNPAWKGKDVGYSALHRWVRRNFTKPGTCEFCKAPVPASPGRMFGWARLAGTGLSRLRNDWAYLCAMCHKHYDCPPRTPGCHPDRRHMARGLCSPCYYSDYDATRRQAVPA